jgi:magnesium transporter
MIMSRWLKKRSGKTGLPPGALVHIGEGLTERTRITVLDYDETNIEEKEISTARECGQLDEPLDVIWRRFCSTVVVPVTLIQA